MAKKRTKHISKSKSKQRNHHRVKKLKGRYRVELTWNLIWPNWLVSPTPLASPQACLDLYENNPGGTNGWTFSEMVMTSATSGYGDYTKVVVGLVHEHITFEGSYRCNDGSLAQQASDGFYYCPISTQ
jgi:hypothetical protein